MKTKIRTINISGIIFLLAVFNSTAHSKQKIIPLLTSRFGEVITIEGTFIAKPRTYYAQNMISEPFLFRILKVRGKSLEKPVVMEYRLSGKLHIMKNRLYTFKAYETIYTSGTPRGWSRLASQMDYAIQHRLILKKR